MHSYNVHFAPNQVCSLLCPNSKYKYYYKSSFEITTGHFYGLIKNKVDSRGAPVRHRKCWENLFNYEMYVTSDERFYFTYDCIMILLIPKKHCFVLLYYQLTPQHID